MQYAPCVPIISDGRRCMYLECVVHEGSPNFYHLHPLSSSAHSQLLVELVVQVAGLVGSAGVVGVGNDSEELVFGQLHGRWWIGVRYFHDFHVADVGDATSEGHKSTDVLVLSELIATAAGRRHILPRVGGKNVNGTVNNSLHTTRGKYGWC